MLLCCGCAANQHQFAGFRSASLVQIIEEIKVHGFEDTVSMRTVEGTTAIRTNAEAPHIPIAEIAQELLSYANLQVAPAGAENFDFILRVTAQGHALTRDYAPSTAHKGMFVDDQHSYVGDRVFTVPAGLALQGTLWLEIPGAAIHQANFRGQMRPPSNMSIEITYSPFSTAPIYLEYAKPSGRIVCDAHGSFTQTAVATLGEIFGIPFLFAATRSRSSPMDDYAADALSRMQVEESDLILLVDALHSDGEWRVRLLAAETLGRIDDKSVVKPLMGALHDSEWHVRQQAVEALGKIGGKKMIAPLTGALHDGEWRVRQQATEALGKIGGARVVAPLIDALQDKEWRVRILAVETLGKIGDKRSVGPLIAALQDAEFGVRYHAVVALEKLEDPRAVGPLVRALDDEDVQFQNRVLMALNKVVGKDIGADPDLWRAWWKQEKKESYRTP